MNVVIGQPRYLPAPSYLHRMVLADLFVYLDCVQYTPRDWENRNRIRMDGEAHWLTVPVLHVSHDQLIKETRIDSSSRWTRKHLGSVRRAYAAATHFEPFFSEYEKIVAQGHEFLIDLNRDLTDWLLASFGLTCQFQLASELEPVGTGDNLLVDLCERVGADIYLSGPHGRDYIMPTRFSTAGVSLCFHDYVHPEYRQLGGSFLPDLSAIDLLFNEGPEGGVILQSDNVTHQQIQEEGVRGA